MGRIYLSLFIEFFKIGLFTIGGGVAMIPVIEDQAVNKKKWLTQDEMIECIALGQSLPGVIAINTSTYVGYKKAGMLGAIFATLGVILPSFMIIILLAGIITEVGDMKFVQGMFTGIKACVTGLVFVVTYDLAKRLLPDKFTKILAVLGFLAVAILNINAILVVIVAGVLGAIYYGKYEKKVIEKISNSNNAGQDNWENNGEKKDMEAKK